MIENLSNETVKMLTERNKMGNIPYWAWKNGVFTQFAANLLGDYVQAEAEGRLLVLPCKAGDTVWYIPSGTRKIYSGICHCVSIQKGGVNIHLYDFDGDAATYPASRVFLTRKEAEAVAAGGQRGRQGTGGGASR